MLSMYSHPTLTPLGQCTLHLHNSKNGKAYESEFAVIVVPLLGSKTIQEMALSMDVKRNQKVLTKDDLRLEYPDVFECTGKFKEPYHLEIDENATLVVHSPRKVPLALKAVLKEELV